jgi:hypothetical protein
VSVPSVAAALRIPYVAAVSDANITLPFSGLIQSAPVSAVPTDVNVALVMPLTAGAVADVAFPATVNVPAPVLLAP